MNVKRVLKKYDHALVFLYVFIYMPWFLYLEQHVTRNYYLIHSPLDDYIPFVEYFIIPYLLWFAFIVVGAFYLFFHDKKEFLKMAAFLILGMSTALLICTVFPNGLNLRPAEFPRDNIFTDLVRFIYATDTPTNVLPSIHVYNSIGMCIGLNRTESLKDRKWIRFGVHLLTVLIILSTMFLKQHSVTDVIAGITLAAVLYRVVYVKEERPAHKLSHQPVV